MIRIFLLVQLLIASYACAEQAERKELRKHFEDVLLIINFNHPHYENIEFLKEIYSPYFKNIVFYGEKEHPEINVFKHNFGWYVHKAIRDAMRKWPYFKGYLCCQDDCFMNFWNFLKLDKNKIWFHQFWRAPLDAKNIGWTWWTYPCGYEASKKAYKKLPKTAIDILTKNCGESHFAYSWADFFYVPGQHSKKFIEISKCFANPEVFIEIAIPTILLSIEDKDRFEALHPLWTGTINSIDLQNFDVNVDWVHPIKFTNSENREFVRKVIDKCVKSD